MPIGPTSAAANRYNHTAWFYEPLATIYSCGRIHASKAHEINYLNPGDRVLYAGVGGGEDAVLAAQKGAQVTCIDLAPAMLAHAERKITRAGCQVELICGDIMAHARAGYYDAICVNFFLNVFTAPVMREVFAHLVTLIKSGGRFMIADFAPPRGNIAARAVHIGYYRIANVLYWLLSKNGLHPIYDYPALFPGMGLKHESTTLHPLFGSVGPCYFQTIIATRRTAPSTA